MSTFSRISALLALVGLAAPAFAQSVTLTGSIAYTDNTITFNGLSAATVNRPMRFANVDVFNVTTGMPAGTGHTDGSGAYSIAVTALANQTLRLRVSTTTARAVVAGLTPAVVEVRPPVVPTVLPNPAVYSWTLQFQLMQPGLAPIVLPQGPVPGAALGVTGSAANVFDVATNAIHRVPQNFYGFGAAAPAGGFPLIDIRWPYFNPPGGAASFAQTAPLSAFINFDDGLDDAVILHEVGHLVDFMYSNNTAPGLPHTFGESNQDPDLSFTEGYATYFGATVMMLSDYPLSPLNLPYPDPGIYMDVASTATPGVRLIGLRARLESRAPFDDAAGIPQRSRGDADELAVAAILWDITDEPLTPGNGGDDDAIHGFTGVMGTPFPGGVSGANQIMQLMAGALANPAAQHRNLTNFWAAWVLGPNAFTNNVRTIMAQVGVDYGVDASEPNDTQATAAPITPTTALVYGPTRTLVHGLPLAVPLSFFDMDQDWYAFPMTAGSRFRVGTRYPGGALDAETMADCAITVHYDNGAGGYSWLMPTLDGSIANSRNELSPQLTAQATAMHYVVVGPANGGVRPYGRYELAVQSTFVNYAPVIGPATASSPLVSSANASAVALSASATDASYDTITYSWYEGTNATPFAVTQATTVAWSPVVNSASQPVTFTVIARDQHGAASAPATVAVQVLAPGTLVNVGSTSIGQTAQFRASVGSGWQCVLSFSPNAIAPTSVAGFNGQLRIDTSTAFIFPTVLGNTAGIASVDVPIPNDPGLIGATTHWQAAYDLTPSPFGPQPWTFSDLSSQTIVP